MFYLYFNMVCYFMFKSELCDFFSLQKKNYKPKKNLKKTTNLKFEVFT